MNKEDYVHEKRRYVIEYLPDDDFNIGGKDEIKLDDLLTTIQEFKKEYPGKELCLEINSDLSFPLFYRRLETDEEYKRRIRKEEVRYKQALSWEKKELAYQAELRNLKRKYGKI